jgi:hypothetical protein
MKRLLLVLVLHNFIAIIAQGQSFTVHDLVTLANTPPKNITHFMNKNGFVSTRGNWEIDTAQTSFIPKVKSRKLRTLPQTSVNLFQKQGSNYFILHLSSLPDYLDGQQFLIKSHFIYDNTKNIRKDSLVIFHKANISIEARITGDSITPFTFKLNQKKIPDSIVYADDLLQFDSNEFLVSYFGQKNVKEDLLYFSEKELKKCSVLFNDSRHQVVFVWGNQASLSNLSYILVSNVLPTQGSKQNSSFEGNNEWKCKNGIHSDMTIKDILRLNEMDFYIYGNKSDFAFMVKPGGEGKIDFKKTAIMFGCIDCYDNQIFNQTDVSALDIAKAHLPMRIFDIIIYP